MLPLRLAIPIPRRPSQLSRVCLSPFVFYRRYNIAKGRPPILSDHHVKSTLPASDSIETYQETLRGIQYAFDPVDTSHIKADLQSFDFLNPDINPNLPGNNLANPINPPAEGVPWPTSFPYSYQSKHWMFTEKNLEAFMRDTYPQDPWGEHGTASEYVDRVVDSAISFVVNVFPTCNPTRLKILARMYALVFMHDDSVDLSNIPLDQVPRGTLSKTGFSKVSGEALDESPMLGKNMIESIQRWASIAGDPPSPTIQNFDDYVAYRIQSAGAEPVFRSVEFGCDLRLSDDEKNSVGPFTVACAKQFALTNDLYSYEKEVAEAEDGEASSNTVGLIQEQTGKAADFAKSIVRQVIWNTETQIHDEYLALLNAYGAEDVRLKYAQSLVLALAGNMFYSATCQRYARAVEGSELALEDSE
ncbi:hypothetical protein PHISCL_07058 [Aspergillus sclerotialis]|uniref:Terpene synthase n=1 Tax=Aspergillus sclerotialis TaxID=2070753 RepID=A0A3A2ZRL9_9EURO|nr:hypothetical protein PHISCL_07058 [Aspergillus sclerotialis]